MLIKFRKDMIDYRLSYSARNIIASYIYTYQNRLCLSVGLEHLINYKWTGQ